MHLVPVPSRSIPSAGRAFGRGLTATCLLAVAVLLVLRTTDAEAATLRVPTDHATIQAGLDASQPGDTVLVAPGTYRGAGNRSIVFPGWDLVVTSEAGAEMTILDVEGTGQNPGRGFLFNGDETPATVLEGFTIENGWMSTQEDRPTEPLFGGTGAQSRVRDTRHDLSGAGFKVNFGAPTIRKLVIRRCHSEYTGGGASVEAAASPKISEISIEDCSAGIQGGGISIETGSTAEVENCSFIGNFAPLGGGVANHATVIMVGCTIAGNRAEYGGGIALYAFTVGTYERTLVWGNCATESGDQIWTDNGAGSLTLECSLVDPDGVVETNPNTVIWNQSVTSDPLFCEPISCSEAPFSGGDFSVSPGSPALHAGSPCGALIGAFEYGTCNVSPYRSWGQIKAGFLKSGNHP
ncbi:MAG: right-handed parallel beta-helix repeat-containing protein [Candidatus Eisenbacteria bacterium]